MVSNDVKCFLCLEILAKDLDQFEHQTTKQYSRIHGIDVLYPCIAFLEGPCIHYDHSSTEMRKSSKKLSVHQSFVVIDMNMCVYATAKRCKIGRKYEWL